MDVVELVQEATAHTDEEWSRDKQKLWICVCVCVCVYVAAAHVGVHLGFRICVKMGTLI